jgi:hypothetical protein
VVFAVLGGELLCLILSDADSTFPTNESKSQTVSLQQR